MARLKPKPSFPTTPMLIFFILGGPFCLAIGIYGIFVVHDAWETGRTYTFGIILNDTAMVSRNDDPIEYWAMVIFMSLTGIVCIPLSIFVPINGTIDYIKKLARQKREKETGRISDSNDHH